MTSTPKAIFPAQVPMLAAGVLMELAEETWREAAKAKRQAKRRKGGATLHPGLATPLWNELVRQALPFLRKRGSKVQLARLLGVSRQRLQVCLKAQRACLDAERTLVLLCWITAQQSGRPLAWQVDADL